MTIAPGSRLGHCGIVSLLGAGGMGEVWLAEDTTLKRKVALKVLPAAVAADPDRLARFQREAEAIAALLHPNIVTIHSIEHEGDARRAGAPREGARLRTRETARGGGAMPRSSGRSARAGNLTCAYIVCTLYV